MWGGEVFAMAGASYAHNKIVTNLARELSAALRDRPRDVLPSDMKVFLPTKPGFVYPDLSVVCDEPRFRDDERDILHDHGVARRKVGYVLLQLLLFYLVDNPGHTVDPLPFPVRWPLREITLFYAI
jgi:hypothetical protein